LNRSFANGPLPPRRTRRKRRKFPVYYGFIVLVLFLFSGVLYAQAGFLGGKEEPSKRADAGSEDLAAFANPEGSDEVFDVDGDKDIELKQEEPDGERDNTLKEDGKDTPSGKKAESKKPERKKSGEGKSGSGPSGKNEAKPVTTRANKGHQSQPVVSDANTASDSLSAFEREVVQLVNQERAKRGLAPLKVDVELSKVARVKSEDMRDQGYFSHDSPTYGSPFDMMKRFGIQFRAAGENIAAGYPTPEAAVKGWMNSSGHRANILSSQFTHIGVGYAKGGAYGHYWTQQFMSK
jgi:uncharacterized YkwD family protein